LESISIPGYLKQRSPGLDWKLILRLASFFRNEAFHIVHCHNQASAFYGGIAAFLARVPVVLVTEHSRNYIQSSTIRQFEKRVICSLVDRWVTVSHELAHDARTLDFLPATKVEVVLNGVDCKNLIQPNVMLVEEIRKACSLSTQDRVVVMVARLHKIKNHELMIRAMQLLVNDPGHIKLVLVGDGENRSELERLVQELGLEEFVAFLGLGRNIPEVLALSDVFVLCSHSEGLPLSLLEAAAAKVKVVITANSNNANFIQNGVSGTVVNDDSLSLAKAIKSVLSDTDTSGMWAGRAQKNVIENYSLQHTVKRYEKLYCNLLNRRGYRA
jgi:glycosyltransferase involved in cell wall biosynthesis